MKSCPPVVPAFPATAVWAAGQAIPDRRHLSFVIPLYNCLALTQDCLRTLQATLPAGLNHEIILVDDGSTDGTRDWLKVQCPPNSFREPGAPPAVSPSNPFLVMLNERNLGFAGACNRGAAAAQGDFIFFLNSDLVLLPGWFEPMRAAFDRFADAGLVGNVQLNAATGAIDHTGLFFNYKGKPEHDTTRPLWARLTGYRPVPALTGACCAIRRVDWRDLGGFDEGYVNGGEDIDLCLRARDAGRHNYVALRSVVRHHVSQSPGRKRRDEENSRRLTVHWRHALAPLAARDWCRHYLETQWRNVRNPQDYGPVIHALFHRPGWLPHRAAYAVRNVQRAIEVELARWRELPDGVPPAATDGSAGAGDLGKDPRGI